MELGSVDYVVAVKSYDVGLSKCINVKSGFVSF